MFCRTCGAEINDKAVICVSCGSMVGRNPVAPQTTTNPRYSSALWFCILLGFVGAHNFYLGKTTNAVLQLVLGLLSCFIISGIWSTIDAVMIISGAFMDADGTPLKPFVEVGKSR